MSVSATAAVARARAVNYTHGPAGDALDFDDVVDRLAILHYALTYHTPEDAALKITTPKGQEESAKTWARMSVSKRQLQRRRAAALVESSLSAAAVVAA